MLGIDIVDLKDPTFKERNSRSLDLIQNEEDSIIDHPNLFWILWSAKEAVFKCKREPLNFAPKKIPITISQENDGISFASEGIKGQILEKDDYMLAICGDLDQIDFHVFEDSNENWGEGVRFMIINYFRDYGCDYHIGSDELNLPTIEPDQIEISISHHGRFGAVAFPKSLL